MGTREAPAVHESSGSGGTSSDGGSSPLDPRRRRSVAMLKLSFFGPLEMRHGEDALPKPPTQKSQSLLAYLVLHRDQPQSRDRLADLFWGERPERKARRSLTTALWHIRRCLPGEPILSDLSTVQFAPQASTWLDVDSFETLASRRDISSLREAVALHRGQLLDGFYDDWIIGERYRLEALFSEALARLMAAYEARQEHGEALSSALRLLEHDALREDAHRAAMRAYCRLGRRDGALEQYRRCRAIMMEELGAEPTAETHDLFREILEGRFEIGRPPVVIPGAEPERPLPVPSGRSPLDVIAPSRLVGREQELALLHDRWLEAASGQGNLVLISGEAGVGKTRLVEESAGRLRWRGVRVLCGRCYEFERKLPYQPFAEALRTVLPTLAAGELAGLPDRTLREVARLVPEVLERYPETELPPDQERAGLFQGVADFLAHLSSQEALLFVLEDLHWASESTLELLHYLTRHLADQPVLLVGTFRPEEAGPRHPLLALRQRLSREGLARPLHLPCLSPAAVETMVVEMSGMGDAALDLALRLYQETEGNPFFLIEISKALFESGAVRLEQGAWKGDLDRISMGEIPLPASVSEAIEARVHRLDDDTQEALRVAAVLGREFDFDVFSGVWGRGKERALQALDDLLRHRFIEEGTGAAACDYDFSLWAK